MRRAALGLFIVCAALFFASGATRAEYGYFYNPCANVELGSSQPLASSDIKTSYGVGLDPSTCGRFAYPQERSGEWMTSTRIDFTPPQWHVARDDDFPDGTKVGEYKSQVTLGILNYGCNLILNLNFDLLDATIDRTNPIDAKSTGFDRLKPLSVKDADGVPAAATKWPSYLTAYADDIGMDLSLLRARMVGLNTTSVSGTTVIFNFLVFDLGATLSRTIHANPQIGWPTVAIFQDPMSPGSPQDPVTDWCAPYWSEQTLFGAVNGVPFRKNPHSGNFVFTGYSLPAPDADSDGIENQLDPCPYTPNTSGWDPRAALEQGVTIGDPDIDGIPDDCDPFPNVPSFCASLQGASQSDEDCDGWANRGDNCSRVANDLQFDSDGDGIGDRCDENQNVIPPSTVDGQHGPVCLVQLITIGVGGSAAPDPDSLSPCCEHIYAEPLSGVPPVCDGRAPFTADVDCDGDTDGLDLLAELKALVGTSLPQCLYLAYTGSCDRHIDTIDIVVFLRYLSGYFESYLADYCPDRTPIP